MSQGWKVIRFNEIFRRIERKIIIDDSLFYRCVGVRWYGLGAFVREQRLGMNINRKQQWVIKSGDIVYNKLFAWKGAFAVADNSVNECIVSDKFPTYEANLELVYPQFLAYFFQTPEIAQQAEALSKGAAAISKLTLNPPQFWDLTIPIPPLDEQRRIVARIEELAAKVEEARGLRRQSVEEANNLIKSLAKAIFKKYSASHIALEKLVGRANLKNGKSIRAIEAPSEVRCIRLSAMRNGQIDCRDSKPIPMTQGEAKEYLVKTGDVFIVRGNGSKYLVGQAGLVKEYVENTIFPDLFIRVPLDSNQILPSFFVAWWNNPLMREIIEKIAITTSGIWKINQGHISSLSIPFPPLPEQHRIVAYLDDIQAKIDTLKRLQAETAAELDALMPSILDKAFKGEL